MHEKSVCIICVKYMYVLYVGIICMYDMFVLDVLFIICLYYMYYMYNMYVLFQLVPMCATRTLSHTHCCLVARNLGVMSARRALLGRNNNQIDQQVRPQAPFWITN